MKQKKVRERTDDDLRDLFIQLKERLRVLRFDLAAGKVKNVREIRSVKKDIARILTEIRSRNKKQEASDK
ncbi:MAG: 50S ribosomal protein L29 [Parcubacteria group bacterium RIFCSPLOWO2_01_FULL_48_18]|nr:MAG: 50S ribosomal protein L29 [Parcubacteria group bacterium RIFCSPLOWO2_01_FULL_48_18]OHB24153.1 MAG: 50S ribosomal protein L29 [Parcubacteria group bacterium RIFCSPHIGHO2_02_FULL_48_10b]